MKKLWCFPWILLGLVVSWAGCRPPVEKGGVRFAVSTRQGLSSANVARVTITSEAVDIPSVTVDLVQTEGTWGGTVGNLPVGPERSFIAKAYSNSGTLMGTARVDHVTIVAGQNVPVGLTLVIEAGLTPIIDSLFPAASAVVVGQNLALQATAHDPRGQSLTASWSASSGAFTNASSLNTLWTAPATSGAATLTLTVTNTDGGVATASLRIAVVSSLSQSGEVDVSILFDTLPNLARISLAPAVARPGESVLMTEIATDEDGDPLTYHWASTCAGTWTNQNTASAEFIPTAEPSTACTAEVANCQLTVTVSDGKGSVEGHAGLCVNQAGFANPIILRSYRSASAAKPGRDLTFEVEAEDPYALPLTFNWSSNVGTFGSATHPAGANSSRITWSSPACVDISVIPTVKVTVSNTLGGTVIREFALAWQGTTCVLPPQPSSLSCGFTGPGGTYQCNALPAQPGVTANWSYAYDGVTTPWYASGSTVNWGNCITPDSTHPVHPLNVSFYWSNTAGSSNQSSATVSCRNPADPPNPPQPTVPTASLSCAFNGAGGTYQCSGLANPAQGGLTAHWSYAYDGATVPWYVSADTVNWGRCIAPDGNHPVHTLSASFYWAGAAGTSNTASASTSCRDPADPPNPPQPTVPTASLSCAFNGAGGTYQCSGLANPAQGGLTANWSYAYDGATVPWYVSADTVNWGNCITPDGNHPVHTLSASFYWTGAAGTSNTVSASTSCRNPADP